MISQPSPARISRTRNVTTKAANVDVLLTEVDDLCQKALLTLGYTNTEACKLREILMYAQLRGNSQGIVKITTGGVTCAPGAQPMTIEKETKLSTVINGRGSNGMLILDHATSIAAEKAKAHGFGIVGTNHTKTSTGALSFYAEKLGKQGLVALVLAQSPEYVAPFGSREAIYGTNPICITVPSISGPVTMDMATSADAWFSILQADSAKVSVPDDVGMNSRGEATTNPADILNGGALRSFDRSHNGSNLALMVELLAGPFVGGAIKDKLKAGNNGNLIIAIDPELLGDSVEFQKRVQCVLDRVKAAELQPGVDSILLPGERGTAEAKAANAAGVVAVEANLLQALKVMASEWEVTRAVPSAAPTADSSPSVATPSDASKPAQGWGISTRMVHPETGGILDPYNAMSPPMYQTATFKQPSATESGPFDYTRSGNPTRALLEIQIADLDSADRAFAFTSGMAALSAVARLVSAGEHIVAGVDIYGGTSRLLSQVVTNAGVTVTNVDHTDLVAYESAFIPGKTKLVFLESPTNPRMQVCDLKELSRIAHKFNVIVMVDNSILTPLYQKPLELGADISMISATKFIGGHADATGGVLSVKGKDLAARLAFTQNAEGTGLAPMECWLMLRGMKTMVLRMEKAIANALCVAQFLESHPRVTSVLYPNLPGTAEAALNAQQATSGGSLVSFTTGRTDISKHVVEQTQLFSITVSFGSTSSLISLPCYMSHSSIPKEVRDARGLPDDLVRLSTGIEDADDLIADLAAALDGAPR